jgi:hypothetical protein
VILLGGTQFVRARKRLAPGRWVPRLEIEAPRHGLPQADGSRGWKSKRPGTASPQGKKSRVSDMARAPASAYFVAAEGPDGKIQLKPTGTSSDRRSSGGTMKLNGWCGRVQGNKGSSRMGLGQSYQPKLASQGGVCSARGAASAWTKSGYNSNIRSSPKG